MELQTYVFNCVLSMCSWISERHLNAACTKVNSWSCNLDSLSWFYSFVKYTCIYLKDQEPFLNDVSPLSPYLIHHHVLPVSLQKFLISFYFYLHYYHLTQPMDISYLESYGNYSSGLAAHSVSPLIFSLRTPVTVIFVKNKVDHIVLCHYLFEIIQCLSIVLRKKAKLLGGSQGSAWAHRSSCSNFLLVLYPPSNLTFYSVPWKCFLTSLVLCTCCFYF